ncbi:ACT domain containing protein [Musa troglodytarum]|uniref:ACT domain containing protein n=1 Tax=Musa troglodytarum TaxID=320322 RepID=A0A9E7GG01_9LILI|nr:ACT domain containing protein [Musa troglodytarum]
MEMLHPSRVMIANSGPDTELLVANPVELSGRGRPSVFYDAIHALKVLGICSFSAEIGRHSSSDRQWGKSTDSSWMIAETFLWPVARLEVRSWIA